MKNFTSLLLILLYSSICSGQKKYYFDIADSLYDAGEYASSVRYFSTSINTKEDTVDAYYGRANSKMALKDYRNAVDDYEYFLKSVKGVEYTRKLGYSGVTLDLVLISHWMSWICYVHLDNQDKVCYHLNKCAEYGNKDAYPKIREYCK